MQITDKIQALKPHQALLSTSKIGLEKEGLRVANKGGIAHTPHPKSFGSALTHPYITTDFSESLLELITPADSINANLKFLSDTQHFVYQHLEHNETLWTQSMPCVIRGETSIDLAQYGPSNLGTMKTVYRRGLGCRYGRTMQVIAGVHFNYSYDLKFWQAYQSILNDKQTLQDFINQHYMGLVRNLLRFGWLVVYLFGASPAVCASFLRHYHQHSLQPLTTGSLYEPFATSLRMGDIGYQNSQEDKIGVKANYNSLSHYTNSLQLAMQTPCEDYLKFNQKKNGQYQQLNANLLQIENEYYTSVRPKQTPVGLEKSIDALNKRGIGYIELRSLDINPLTPLGVDKPQLQFLESLFLFCLLNPSPAISSSEQVAIDTNTNLVAHQGRDPLLKLNHQDQQISLKSWGATLCQDIKQVSVLLSKSHSDCVDLMAKRLDNTHLTPSQIMIDKMQSKQISFFDLSKKLSLKYQTSYQDKVINQAHFDQLTQHTLTANIKQKVLEQDKQPFDEYLHHYLYGTVM